MTKFLNILLYSLLGASVVVVLMLYKGGVVSGTENTQLEEPIFTGLALVWATIFFVVATVAAIGFSIAKVFSDKEKAIKALITLGIFGGIILISYLLSSDELLNLTGYTGTDNVPTTLKIVDTGLITTYVLISIALLSILYTNTAKYFKK